VGQRSLTLLIMATMLEARPFIPDLDLRESTQTPFPIFRNDRRILMISGIGKAHAAAATAYGCAVFNPGQVINAGAAGALDMDHPLGEIYQIRKVIEHDRPHLLTNRPVSHKPAQMNGINGAVLASGDRPVIDPGDRLQLSGLADLVDMEAAAVAQTCLTMGVPCYVFKLVSDALHHSNGIDIIKNIRSFRSRLSDFCLAAVLPILEGGREKGDA